MKMKIRPLADRVLVSRVSAEEVSAGGILIPQTAQNPPSEAMVIAVGEGRLLNDGTIRPLSVKKGDRVMFGKYTGTDVEMDGEKLLMMSEDDILAVVEK